MKWGVTPSETEQYKSPEALAKDVMTRSIEKLGLLDRTEYVAKVNEAKTMMAEINNPKSNIINSGGDTPLEDVFYVYEGMFNNEFGELMEAVDDMERVEETFTVDVHQDMNNEYFIYNTDLTNFYSDLAISLGIHIDETLDEVLVICDLNLVSIDNNSNTATIKGGIAFGPRAASKVPNAAIWAAQQLGSCSQTEGGYDAADFLRHYANNSVSTPNNSLIYPIALTGWISYDPSFASSYTHWDTHAWSYAWHGENNVCLGYTTTEWHNLNDDMDLLIGEGLSWAQTTLPSTPNLQFLFTTYQSHTGPLTGVPASDYYHGGLFGYGIIM